MTQRRRGTELIRSGGFQGGVAVRPQAPANDGSQLIQIANAIGGLNNSAMGAYRARQENQMFDAEQQARQAQEDALRYEQKQEILRDEAAQEAEVIRSQFVGYNAQQIGEQLQSDPMVQRFQRNPFLLPALTKYQGTVAADELVTSMIDAGVHVDRPEEVQAFLRENGPDTEDPFFASGFNEQMQRRLADFSQRAITSRLEQAASQRGNAAVQTFELTFQETGSVTEALSAMRNSELGLSGPEQTEVQMNILRSMAAAGQYEMAMELANAPRGDAPALSRDSVLLDDVTTLLEQARTNQRQSMTETYERNHLALEDRIRAGASRREIESDPRFQELPASRQRTLVNRVETALEERRQENARRDRELAEFNAATTARRDAYTLLLSGRGGEIEDTVWYDEDVGVGGTIRRSELIDAAKVQMRQDYLGDDPLNLPDEELDKYNIYTRRLSQAGEVDELLRRHLSGAGALMTSEAFAENASEIAGMFRIYQNLDPTVARQYVDDTHTRAVFRRMDELQQRYPSRDPEQIARQAVTLTDQSVQAYQPNSREVSNALRGVEIEDPINREKTWFGLGSRPEEVTIDVAEHRDWLTSRANEYAAMLGDYDLALEEAMSDFRSEHTVVNGQIVQMPHAPEGDPNYTRVTPEAFARNTTAALRAFALQDAVSENPEFDEEDLSIEGYRLRYAGGNTYYVTKPNNEIEYATLAQLNRMGETQLLYENDAENAEFRQDREEAARRAVRRN